MTKTNSKEAAILRQLKLEIKDAGFSLRGLADAMDRDYYAVRKNLAGDTEIKLAVLLAICDQIGVPLETVIDRAEQRLRAPSRKG